MKRIITIAALVVLVFSTSFAQPMKWKKLADRILASYINTSPNPDVREFGAIETKDSIVLAGWGSVSLSTDGGKSWTRLSIPGMGSFIYDIAIYDNNTFVIGAEAGVLITSDQGQSWENLLTGNAKAVMFDGSPDKIISIGYSGVALLGVGGSRVITSFPENLSDLQIGADNALYLLSSDHNNYTKYIYRSIDRFTWTLISQFIPGDYDCYSFICDRDDANRFVIVNEDWAIRYDEFSEIFTSTDGAKTWNTSLQTLLGSLSYLTGNSTQGCNDYFVGSNPDGILRSNDKGVSWSSIGGPPTPIDSRTICALDDSIIFAIDTFGSIWVTDALRATVAGTLSTDSTFQKLSLQLCDSSLKCEIVFHSSKSCSASATIDSAVIIGADSLDYSFERALSSPAAISDTVRIRFTPSIVGATDAKLKVTYSNGVVRYVDLSTTVTPPAVLSFTNASNIDLYTGILGDDVTIPIQLKKSIDANCEFLIHYDTTYLEYKGTFDDLGVDHTTENKNGRVRIGCNPNINTSLYASFTFFPIDSNCTSVRIDSLSSLDALACVVIEDTVFTATICGPEGCGINTLSRFIRYGTTPEFTITPNPSRGTITLQSNIDIEGASIDIRNEVGAITYSTHSDINKANGLSLDVSSLPSGAYILLVKGHGAGVPLVIMK